MRIHSLFQQGWFRILYQGIFCIFLLNLIGRNAALAQNKGVETENWRKIPVPALPAFTPQKPEQIKLPNGITLFLQPDHATPLITVQIWINGGFLLEPKEKVGLTSVLSKAWISGGSERMTGDEIDHFLGQRGIQTSSKGESSYVALTFTCLPQYVDETLSIFEQVVTKPQFRQDKIDLVKAQLKTAVAKRNDDAYKIATREISKLIYGESHPYSQELEYFTIDSITRKDLIDFHQNHLFGNQILIGVSGDFDPSEIKTKLQTRFGSIKPGSFFKEPIFEIHSAKPGVYLIPKSDINQSQIYFGQMGLTQKHPDYYALTVMNRMLGGGFSWRLFDHIRTQKGLAYGIDGGIDFGWNQPGKYTIDLGTSSQTTKKAIDAVFEELQDFAKYPPSAAEVERAKKQILNSNVFEYESKESTLSKQMTLHLYKYPDDFLETFPERIKQVTPEDIKRVISTYLKPDQFRILVVGKEADFDQPLSALGLGPVTKIDITIPTVSPSQKTHSLKK